MARSAEPCELTASIMLDGSVQHCWDLYTDNTLTSQWVPAVQRVDCTAATMNKGVVRKSQIIVNGKSGHTVELCTVFEPLKRIDMMVTEETFGFAHMLTSYGLSTTFDVDGENTLVVMQTRYTPKRIFASVMSSKATQNQLLELMNSSLNGFKQYVHSR